MRWSLFTYTVLWVTFTISPAVSAERVFFGNLHSHTSYSDGSGTPSQAFVHARDVAKLDFLAITEHNHRRAEDGASSDRADGILIATSPELYLGPASSALIPAAGMLTESGKFIALYGQEFSSISKGNHANVFDIGAVIDDQVVTNGGFGSLLTWLETHPDSGGSKAIIQFNHARLLSDSRTEYGADDFPSQGNWVSKMGEHVVLFEMLNGPATTKTSGNRVEEVMESDFEHYLQLGFHLGPTGDQDNHYETWGTATDVRTAVITDELTKPKLLQAMRNRHVYATEDKNLRLIFKVNGHLCGDVLPKPEVGTELTIAYTIQDDDEPSAGYQIEVRSGRIGGQTVDQVEIVSSSGNTTNPRSIDDVHYTGGAQFIYFKIIQANEHGVPDRSWTAPVWFETPGQSNPGETDESGFVASKNSSIYHVSMECKSAKTIKPANRLTGSAAKEGRTKHNGCPIK